MYFPCPWNLIDTSTSSLLLPTTMEMSLSTRQLVRTSAIHRRNFVMYSVSAGTHSVVAVKVATGSSTEITCIFKAGSHAIGCLINLTHVSNGNTYCTTLQRYSNISESNRFVLQSCNATFVAGRYLLKAHDTEQDGNISKFPAVIEEVLLHPCATMVPEPSFSRIKQSNFEVYSINVHSIFL